MTRPQTVVAVAGVIATTAVAIIGDRMGLSTPVLVLIVLVCGGLILAAEQRMMSNTAHLSWADIEKRFKELQSRANEIGKGRVTAVQILRNPDRLLVWYVGSSTDTHRQGIEQVCGLAGAKVRRDKLAKNQRALKADDDVQRWLWFLLEVGVIPVPQGETHNGDFGGNEPNTYIHVEDLTAASLAGCLYCIHAGTKG